MEENSKLPWMSQRRLTIKYTGSQHILIDTYMPCHTIQHKTHSFVHRALSISDKKHLQTELNYWKQTYKKEYNKKDMDRIISKYRSRTKNNLDTQQPQEELDKRNFSILPYVKKKTTEQQTELAGF